jgi:hypothetical protein
MDTGSSTAILTAQGNAAAKGIAVSCASAVPGFNTIPARIRIANHLRFMFSPFLKKMLT